MAYRIFLDWHEKLTIKSHRQNVAPPQVVGGKGGKFLRGVNVKIACSSRKLCMASRCSLLFKAFLSCSTVASASSQFDFKRAFDKNSLKYSTPKALNISNNYNMYSYDNDSGDIWLKRKFNLKLLITRHLINWSHRFHEAGWGLRHLATACYCQSESRYLHLIAVVSCWIMKWIE